MAVQGCTELSVLIGEGGNEVRKIVEFVVVDGASAYNAILGRPYIHDLQAVLSTLHSRMKYPIKNGVGVVRRVESIKKVLCNCFEWRQNLCNC